MVNKQLYLENDAWCRHRYNEYWKEIR